MRVICLKAYFDTNIFEHLDIDSANKLNNCLSEIVEVYIGVGHVEELAIAIENDTDGKNQVSNQQRQRIMEILADSRILGPYGTDGKCIGIQYSNIKDCMNIINKHDTRSPIRSIQQAKCTRTKIELDSLRSKNPQARFYSTLDPSEIWDTPEMKTELENFSNYYATYNDNVYKVLLCLGKYEKEIIDQIRDRILVPDKFTLAPGCFSEIKTSYALLECVFEFLNQCLTNVGYNVDKSSRTFCSGAYDLQHTITATYCDYFVTRDQRLCKRASALYNYTGAETKAMLFDNFMNEIVKATYL